MALGVRDLIMGGLSTALHRVGENSQAMNEGINYAAKVYKPKCINHWKSRFMMR